MALARKAKVSLPGNKIKLVRNQRGLSMKALAEMVGTSQQQIDRLEKGRRRMTVEWLERISEALNCPVNDFLPEGRQSNSQNSDAERSAEYTARAKVIGDINNDGKISWRQKEDIYPVVFGRPEILGSKVFAVMVKSDLIVGFPRGSELIFSEIAESSVLSKDGKMAIFELSSNNGPLYFVDIFPSHITEARLKAILIKSIRNE